MRVAVPSYKETRGDSVLLVWGDLPFWMVVDRQAATLVEELAECRSLLSAVKVGTGDRANTSSERDAARVLSALRNAGVLGHRRLSPPKERLESISVNVTNRCNLQCSFCYNGRRRQAAEELSTEEMILALEGLRRWTARRALLALLGGEPLLEKEKTLALARWAKRRGLVTIVSTNGFFVDREFALHAAESSLQCQVSLDGIRAETHDAVRGAGSYDRALHAVETLVEAGAHTLVSMVVHVGNADEIPDYLRMGHALGVHAVRFIPVKKIAGGTGFEPPDPVRLIRRTAELAARDPELGKLLGRDYVSILARTCRWCSRRQTCGTGSQTLLLDADGTVYPCLNLAHPEMAAGNIRTMPMKLLWQSSQVLARVRCQVRLSARTGGCSGCFVRHWCLGGCRGETYENTGSLTAPALTCSQNRAAIIEMLWTLAQHPGILLAGPRYC